KRRYADRDDLRLAPPGEHPPVGDDRRQPARPLPLGPRADGHADRPVLPPVRRGRVLRRPDRRLGGVDAEHGRGHAWPILVAAERYFASGRRHRDSILGNPGTEFIYAGGGLVNAWPAAPDENEYIRVRDSSVATLMIGGTLDFATPAVNATKELLPHLPNGRQVVLSELGHSTSFWTYQPKASTRLLNAFLDSGKVDTSLYTRAKVDFIPDVTYAALGK